MYRAVDLTEIWKFTAVGEVGVFPFTVDSANKYAYVCHRQHVGFDILDLESVTKEHSIDYGTQQVWRTSDSLGYV